MKTQPDNFSTSNLATTKKRVSMKMMYHENRDAVLKDKKRTEKIKEERKEDKLNKSLNKMKEEECLVTCSKTKLLNTVMKNKIMMKHNLVMMMSKEGGSKNQCMKERELESRKLC